MDAWFAYGLISAFALFQTVPLVLAFQGRIRAWFLAHCAIGIAMLALADLQYGGRSSFVVLGLTAFTILATSAISAILAVTGFHMRASRSRLADSEVL